MTRRPTDARDRLRRAALTMFSERGFDGTVVAEIAAEAGLTERTFYRYFSDKREAMFMAQEEFNALFLDGFADYPESEPRALIARAVLRAAAEYPNDRRPWSRERQAVLDADVRFRERELLKLSTLASVLADALTARGIEAPLARVAADSASSVFRLAFDTWVARDDATTLVETAQSVFASLDRLVGPAERRDPASAEPAERRKPASAEPEGS
jgi:AcrR family transcriptional regulator